MSNQRLGSPTRIKTVKVAAPTYQRIPVAEASGPELQLGAKFAGLDAQPDLLDLIEADRLGVKGFHKLTAAIAKAGYTHIAVDPANRLTTYGGMVDFEVGSLYRTAN